MSSINKTTMSVWKTLYTNGILNEDIHSQLGQMSEFNVFDQVQETQQELMSLEKECDTEHIKKMTLEELSKLPFDSAKQAIDGMSIEKRITMLNDIDTYLVHLYSAANNYCGDDTHHVSKENILTAAEFRSLLGKIKHLEVLQQWLYGIA